MSLFLPSIVVAGSSNTDMVVQSTRIPEPGETILGGSFFMNGGGKGANQAVAAARLGGRVSFIANLGDDIFGRQALAQFQREGIDTRYISIDASQPSGVALIMVDDHGENSIVVAPGANGSLSQYHFDQALPVLERATVLLMQLEVPVTTVVHACSLAHARGMKVILNPAPACALPASLFSHVSIMTPNETEATLLTGVVVKDIASAGRAADVLLEKGVEYVVVTLGEKGALLKGKDVYSVVPAPEVAAVDTTAAGDVFNGALAVALAEGLSMEESVRFACKASAISVTRMGAQASAPYRNEIN